MKRDKEKPTKDCAFYPIYHSDVTLHILKNGCLHKETIYVSKLHLASKSRFFRQMFLINDPEIDFVLDKDTEINHFVDLIRLIYKHDPKTPPEDLLSVLKLADKYEVDTAIKSCAEVLGKQDMTLEKACTFLNLSGDIKKHPPVEQFLVKPASDFVLHKFQRVRDLFRSKEFLELPLEAVLVLVKSDDLIVDSENSVLYFIMYWILKDPETRENCFPQFLPYIRFSQMLKYFLLDIVPYIATHFKDPIRLKILEAQSLALESHVGGSRRIMLNLDTPHLFVPRATLQDPLQFTIKCIFKGVNWFNLYETYYSEPFFAHGYEFYFFLRKQRITPQNPNYYEEKSYRVPADYTLAGYLRCTSRFLPNPLATSERKKHFLPICREFSILLRGNLERKFTPSRIVFESSEKSTGGKLTIMDENWSNIVSGESVIVVDNTVTVMVTVQFLNSDEGCELLEVHPPILRVATNE